MIIKRVFIFLAFASLLGGMLLFLNTTEPLNSFELLVPKLLQLDFLETQQHYWWLMLVTIIPVALLSYDKKVHYYTHWPTLFPAIIIIGLWFIGWDAVFTAVGIWGFNPHYHQASNWLGLPAEEWTFFFAVPFASYFIHVCLKSYWPNDTLAKWDRPISLGLGGVMLLMAALNWDKSYTAITMLLTGVFLIGHYFSFSNDYRTLFYRSFVVILLPFLIIDGSLTGWFTREPIVLYHPQEYLGIRLGSAPVEDAIYGFLLILLIATLKEGFEEIRGVKRTTTTDSHEKRAF